MDQLSPSDALAAVRACFKSQQDMAAAFQVTQGAVCMWLKRAKLPAERVLKAEALTGISRHDLRPDIYPREVPQCPSAFVGLDRGTARTHFNRGGETQGASA